MLVLYLLASWGPIAQFPKLFYAAKVCNLINIVCFLFCPTVKCVYVSRFVSINASKQFSSDSLKEGHCTLFFCHSHSHSHNDIGNVYLLFLSKATG